ncbi:MAG TPA: sulfatase-like hydrolase/transferase [Kofleriaceae bacterium]
MQSRIRARLVVAARWLVPSVVAAAVGAVVAGALEGRAMATPLGFTAAAGFVALLAIPLLVAAFAILRGVWAAWRPRELAGEIGDDGAPWLVGWIAATALGTIAVAWAVFQGTWLLVSWTAFKPLAVSLGVPAFAVGAAVVAVAASRPIARGLAWVARSIDARWRRRGHRTLLAPHRIAIAFVIAIVVGVAPFWRFVVAARFAGLAVGLSTLAPALIGFAAAAIVHVAWHRLGAARMFVTAVAAACALLAIGGALAVSRVRPSLALAIWGDRPLAGFAVGALFDTGAMRTRVSRELVPVSRAGAAHPDIVLVVLDSARADHVPPLGRADMPGIADLARRGAVFERAFAPSNVTRRALPAMLSGVDPTRLRGRDIGESLRADPRHVLLAERLAAGGYATAGFACCALDWDGPFRAGLDRGLGHFEVDPDPIALADRARAWLEARAKRGERAPLFVAIHLRAPNDWARAGFERTKVYDRALASYDHALAIVLAGFAQGSPPIVIVTSDHGDGLGEHAASGRAAELYDGLTHVPLIVVGPGIATVRVPETVGLVGLVPSVLELAGFVPPAGPAIDGTSFAPLATGARAGNAEAGVAFAASASGTIDVISGRWKLVENGATRELYDTRTDPDERWNVYLTHRDVVSTLEHALDDYRARANRSPFE